MFPLLLTPHIVAAHRSDLLKDAERHRLLRQARSTRQSLLDRLLAGLGVLLISVGKRLQESNAPVVPHGCAACPSEC